MIRFVKNKKIMVIISSALIAALAITGYSVSTNAAMSVNAYTADKGSLESDIEVNGTVESGRDKVYYADIDARIGNIHIKEGDFVKKGDIIISYDQEDLERMETMTNLEAKADLGSYNNSIQTGNRNAGLYSEAKKNLAVLDQQITDTQEAITRIQSSLAERRASLADFGAKLQVSLIDWADKPDSEEYENLQKLVQTNAYEQQYADDIVSMEQELNSLNVQLADLKEYKAEMTSQKASTVMNLMTEGAKEQLEAVKEANDISNEEKIADYNEAKEGIRADFEGIVTEVNVIEGSSVSRGTKLFTLKSTADIIIISSVNKYDIVNIEVGQTATVNIKKKDYQGKVTRIERMTKDSGTGTGIGVEIALDVPGEDIILGLEAKSKIHTSDLSEVIRIPLEALSEDEEGSYVFVAEDGKAVKEFVECGSRNEDMVEIKEGLSEGSLVVWKESQELTDGMGVKVNK
ncbi:efflux RND transporter periplasmic adaptor subunit [Butyrivibrio sp. YAB3001]|uniref:efflux RND transporter periplasmic adaptor subunit n=1 Tax=Butyrivibrio sp. YAB3001 TaxID=1520812 RepID=UPI0008F62E9B|nr:efflux RND transporter periplasmic adaptor subunit [Butyrivibrio sp. YAB3001]SFB75368.1 RND family efflux transporter, MFP subunit [Butyrivibrio sp. YAB3001]